MMERIIILGAGGLGKEVSDLIRETNQYEIVGFLDDDPQKENTQVNQIPVLGKMNQLFEYQAVRNLVVAIANPIIKKNIAQAAVREGFQFPNLIHPSAIFGSNVSLGQGNIICAGVILSTDVSLHDYVIINPQCGIGHESVLHSYTTLYWNVHIGGNTVIRESCELGTHSCVLQGLEIAGNVILGAGAVATKNIEECGTYIGVPAKRL